VPLGWGERLVAGAGRSAAGGLVADACAVVAAWAGAVVLEGLAIPLLWGAEFSGSWEIAQAKHLVEPVAVAGLAPLAIAAVGVWRLAVRATDGSRRARWVLGALGGAAAAAVGLGVSTGRHLAAPSVRALFVAVVAAVGVAAGARIAPSVAALRRQPTLLGLLGLLVAPSAWLADAFVLPRLYPAFHLGCLAMALLGAALVGLAGRGAAKPSWRTWAASAAVVAGVVACAARTPRAADALGSLSNVRLVLVEHAPLLGRTVQAIERAHPQEAPPPAADATAVRPGEVERALDWSGHDLVLLTVDALRADHVSAYGYARPTTPSLDALAREGTAFDAAYCPTPHTSYSVTSMMAGKYMRPLLRLGLGDDSETWAQHLRRYGWRTAAFYPPAVFFIDEDRFSRFEQGTLGFEYAKVEFADPSLRERQVGEYLEGAPAGTPIFLWVHFFEPHEPYVAHPDHAFSGGRSADEDAYDGEIAEADEGIGRVVRQVRARRPGAVILVTADHGEEFGEHGGRYHGTTVYEEQVRVPLVVVGPGVRRGARASAVVQTIDLLPTVLSALGIPRPARLRGRDLGPLLARAPEGGDEGFAFAETDDYALVAAGPDRLVCERRAAACALYRPSADPRERHDEARDRPERFDALRGMLRAVERDHGRYEAAAGAWPEALRRGMTGDTEAARDVASLLDDADVTVRRKAAEVSFALHASETAPELRRALDRDEDDEVRRWTALALVRASGPARSQRADPNEASGPARSQRADPNEASGPARSQRADPNENVGPASPVPPAAEALLKDASQPWRRRAALALGERGDARACDELVAWWSEAAPAPGEATNEDGQPPRLRMELAEVHELLGATVAARCRSATPALVRALADVRARPRLADALGALGDDRARAPLLALLSVEPYVTTRPHEARALLALGVRDWSAPAGSAATSDATMTLRLPEGGGARLLVLVSDAGAGLEAVLDGAPLAAEAGEGELRSFVLASALPSGQKGRLDLRASRGQVTAVWLIRMRPQG
jgi:arylsulfatase A-like enzyme